MEEEEKQKIKAKEEEERKKREAEEEAEKAEKAKIAKEISQKIEKIEEVKEEMKQAVPAASKCPHMNRMKQEAEALPVEKEKTVAVEGVKMCPFHQKDAQGNTSIKTSIKLLGLLSAVGIAGFIVWRKVIR